MVLKKSKQPLKKIPILKFVWYDLSTFVLKNLHWLFDNYAIARTEHDAFVKSATKIFSNFVAFSENPNFNLPLSL